MTSTRLNSKRAGLFSSAVSTFALLALPTTGASADQHEKIDTLQLQIDELQKEFQEVKEQTAEMEARGPTDERVLGPREMRSGSDDVSLTISGQVNRGILVAYDGDETDVFFVDNDNSSTRIRLLGDARFNEDISVGSVIEVQFESNSTADVSQDNQRNVGDNNFTERKLEVFVDSGTYGRLWLGQGDTASNGTAEVDLSGTSVVAYSGIADFAGGIQFQGGGVLSGVTVGDSFDNLDGLSRDDRIRYDTPVYSGAKFSASAIADDRWDVALRYAQEVFGAHEFETAISFADVDDDFDQVSASASLLLGEFVPGASLTLATGFRDFEEDGRESADFIYGKAGYQFSPFAIGKTALSIDYYYGEDIGVSGDEASSIGVVAVQNIDRIGTEVYAGARAYELERVGENFEPVDAYLFGARVKF